MKLSGRISATAQDRLLTDNSPQSRLLVDEFRQAGMRSYLGSSAFLWNLWSSKVPLNPWRQLEDPTYNENPEDIWPPCVELGDWWSGQTAVSLYEQLSMLRPASRTFRNCVNSILSKHIETARWIALNEED